MQGEKPGHTGKISHIYTPDDLLAKGQTRNLKTTCGKAEFKRQP